MLENQHSRAMRPFIETFVEGYSRVSLLHFSFGCSRKGTILVRALESDSLGVRSALRECFNVCDVFAFTINGLFIKCSSGSLTFKLGSLTVLVLFLPSPLGFVVALAVFLVWHFETSPLCWGAGPAKACHALVRRAIEFVKNFIEIL